MSGHGTSRGAGEEFFQHLLEVVIKPNAEALGDAYDSGAIVVVAYEPNGAALASLRAIGWDGTEPVCFRMSNGAARRMARACEQARDLAGARFFGDRRRKGRVFIFHTAGTILASFDAASGVWSTELGSTDREWMS